MSSKFEDHCWIDVVSPEVLDLYSHYARETAVGPSPALLVVDLYELAYQGGAFAPEELHSQFPSSCGKYAHEAIEPTKALLTAARGAQAPVFYTTQANEQSSARKATATRRQNRQVADELYHIRAEFTPSPQDIVVKKQRASAFFGTNLIVYLLQRGIRTVIVCGQSTSGCVRASVLDAYSYGFHVVVVEECCFDRFSLTHKVNLFDIHHKYGDVMHLEEVISALIPAVNVC